MKQPPLIAVLLLALIAALQVGSRVHAARESAPRETPDPRPAIKAADHEPSVIELIQQLGDDQYAVRRRAEEELIRLGPEAFDPLRAAEDDSDLEVAERARYIVARMRVDWVRPDDPAEVRRIMARYGDLSEGEREKRISRLNELKNGEGLPAICRIIRMERSPEMARRAALAVLNRESAEAEPASIADACRHELGLSERPPVAWIKLWLREQTDRRATLADWNAALEAEAALLKEESPETNLEIVHALMERRLEMCHELGLVDETTAALLRMVALRGEETAEQSDSSLGWAMRWIIQRQRWDVLDQVHQQRREQVHGNRRLLYYLAGAFSRAGRDEQASKLADQAFEMKADSPEERAIDASSLAEIGFVDWAEREFERALEELPVISAASLAARREWAVWLHDREKYKRAAEVIQEFFDAGKQDPPAMRKVVQDLEGRVDLGGIRARGEYYRACYYESRQEYDRQRESLEKAWKYSQDDPDVLIAMYRWKSADDAFRDQTRQLIQQMSQKHMALIEEYPEVPFLYNQRAWLVSNTEGDYAQAVEHSLRSLELEPDEPSYLDTLGRCYFAAGDLENAVKAQRKAVELAPHYQIMQRQLKQFEEALAASRQNK